jgi:hypothetical protein
LNKIIVGENSMENNQRQISVRDLTEEITLLVKDEILATYTEEESALQVHFLNGQNFQISVEEMK